MKNTSTERERTVLTEETLTENGDNKRCNNTAVTTVGVRGSQLGFLCRLQVKPEIWFSLIQKPADLNLKQSDEYVLLIMLLNTSVPHLKLRLLSVCFVYSKQFIDILHLCWLQKTTQKNIFQMFVLYSTKTIASPHSTRVKSKPYGRLSSNILLMTGKLRLPSSNGPQHYERGPDLPGWYRTQYDLVN